MRFRKLATLLLLLSSVATAFGKTGWVSYYSTRFAGKRTASGQRYNPRKHTAAHRKLPFGTCVKLWNRARVTYVTINDRGPWIKGRIFDVSSIAAYDLRLHGVRRFHYQVVPPSYCARQN